MKTKHNITGIILAGGKSSRMGTDKGLMLLHGKTFIEHIIQALKPTVDEIIIVANNDEYDRFGETRIDDLIQDSGPLAGLFSGLKRSKTDLNLVLSCDVPFITTRVLRIVTDAASDDFEIIQAVYKNESLPHIGLYRKKCMVKSKELLDQGEKRLRSLARHFKTKDLHIDEVYEKNIQNINTLQELKSLLNEIEN
ncbi:MAG: molybdenum cofactor guanylyltransferase [Bacteroidia bacterium]|nr:molybdenum cofactor guanylyltransferase [Bacteroidia bacterium]